MFCDLLKEESAMLRVLAMDTEVHSCRVSTEGAMVSPWMLGRDLTHFTSIRHDSCDATCWTNENPTP